MPSPPNITNITPPRVPFLDERTGLIAREWYRFFLNIFNLTGGGTNTTSLTDLQVGPPFAQIDEFNTAIDAKTADLTPTQESALDEIAELSKQVEALAVLPLTSWVLSELAELQTQIDGLLAAAIPPVNFLTNGASILYGDNLGGFSNVTIGSGVSFSGGTLSATGSGGTVTSVTGAAPITSTGGTTPVIGVTAAALTKVDDTNVTLTLGGTPTTSLLAATSLTLGWTGQLGLTRGGTNASLTASAGSVAYSTASALALNTAGSSGDWLKSAGTAAPTWTASAALTKTDDTNVTLTLGGSASTALLNAASLTLGWTGQLAATRGGTGFGSYAVGDILYANTTTTLAKLADVATGNALISGGVGVAPAWGKIGLTTHVSGTLPVTNGGTGTATAFTAGSVVFAGASGVYSQDNANFFWDDTNNRLGLGNVAPACALDVTGGIQTSRTGVTSPATTDGNVFSGTYTPALTNTTNVAASSAGVAQYMRVGNVVTVSGQVDIDPTATGDTIMGVSLPVASNINAQTNCGGTFAVLSGTIVQGGSIYGDSVNDRVTFRMAATDTANRAYQYHFTYRVI